MQISFKASFVCFQVDRSASIEITVKSSFFLLTELRIETQTPKRLHGRFLPFDDVLSSDIMSFLSFSYLSMPSEFLTKVKQINSQSDLI